MKKSVKVITTKTDAINKVIQMYGIWIEEVSREELIEFYDTKSGWFFKHETDSKRAILIDGLCGDEKTNQIIQLLKKIPPLMIKKV